VVAGVGGVQRVDGLEAPLAGRERELRLVKELFHATEESGRPRLVVLDGEAGIGKSRLAWEFSKYVDGLSSTVRWHQGRCLSYGDGAAYWALAEAVRARLGLVDEASAPESADALDRAMRQWVVDEDERAWLGPRLASLLGQPIEAGREDLYAAWTRFFERLAEGAEAVVLVIDDGHHADDGLLDFVRYLVSSGRAPIFVLLLARPELLEAQAGLGGRRGTVVRLQPLPDTAMGALVDGLVVGLPAPARAQLVQRAEGVPLYAVETVRALIDRDLVTPQGGQYVVTPGTELDLSQMSAPASLHALVAARLDALSAGERRVVADASVLGASFTREGIEVLCHDVPHLPDVLESLCRKEVVAADSDRFSSERGQYRFMQTVVRQVAYTTLSRRDRKSRHLLVAEHLSAQLERLDDLAVVIAQHLVDAMAASAPADPDVPDLRGRATRLLDQAASRACSLGSYTDGLRLLRTALAYCDDPSAHVRLLERAADTAVILTDYETARELAQQALEARDADGDPLAAARAVQLYGLASVFGGSDRRLALEFLDERLARLSPLPSSDAARLRVLDPLVLGTAATEPGSPRILQLAHDRVRLAERLQDEAALTKSLAALALVEAQQGAREVAVALNQLVLVRSRSQEDWRAEAQANANLADSLMAVSPARAIDIAEQAVRSARDHGLQTYAEITALNLTLALWCAGHWDRLAEVLTELDDPAEAHHPASRPMTMSVDLWRVGAGLPPLVTPTELPESVGVQEQAWRLHLAMLRGRLSGDLAVARQHAAGVMGDELRDGITQGDFFMLWAESVRTAVASGDIPLCHRLLLLVTERGPGDVPPGLRAHLHAIRAAVAIAEGGDPVAIERDLRAGVEAFEAFGSPPYLARTQGELAGWLVSQGRDAEAEPLFAAARGTLLDLGASKWLAALDVRRATQAGRG
jgi:tetratricopeptide (TPR) repeat protein